MTMAMRVRKGNLVLSAFALRADGRDERSFMNKGIAEST